MSYWFVKLKIKPRTCLTSVVLIAYSSNYDKSRGRTIFNNRELRNRRNNGKKKNTLEEIMLQQNGVHIL